MALSYTTYKSFAHPGTTATVANVVIVAGDVIRACVSIRDTATPPAVLVTAFNYNATEALTEIAGSRVAVSNSDMAANAWKLDNPSVGTHDVVVTWGASQNAVVMVVVVHGVDLGTPTDAVVTANGVSAAPTVSVTTTAGDAILAFCCDKNTNHTLTVTSPSTETDRIESAAHGCVRAPGRSRSLARVGRRGLGT